VSPPIVRVPVDTAGRPYEVLIGPGLVDQAGVEIARLRPGARVGIVADETVNGLHGPRLRASLDAAGIGHETITVAPGEASKSWAGLARVTDGLLAARIERRDLVVALGGGVVGDLAGFAAGILRRGVDVVQIPTSLLAQVDSSVGGKTGINTAHGKNLIGVFQQPKLVLADTGALGTLPARELRAGYAEVVKYGLLGDAAFFAWLERHGAEVLAGGPARIEAVAASVRAKAAIVARDEFETGDRALLNLGHTFGHALEAVTGYSSRLLHGEAVAIGMAQAFRFSARVGLIGSQLAARVEAHLSGAGLPTRVGQIPGEIRDVGALMTAIRQDKKVSRGALTFILARDIGAAFVEKGVDPAAIEAFLREEVAGS
jgi:3-dehydroquinate synthase